MLNPTQGDMGQLKALSHGLIYGCRVRRTCQIHREPIVYGKKSHNFMCASSGVARNWWQWGHSCQRRAQVQGEVSRTPTPCITPGNATLIRRSLGTRSDQGDEARKGALFSNSITALGLWLCRLRLPFCGRSEMNKRVSHRFSHRSLS